ncbi:MAG TPA: hypothetical protein VFD92_20550 [Candidatus Binatia bacterium]|nr:hypothetical protein [Candidatus Binatia bacterium]
MTGYEGSTSVPHAATGTACLNAAGTQLYVNWNVLRDEGTDIAFYSVRMKLPYPSLTGGFTTFCSSSAIAGINCGANSPESAFPCVPAPLP